MNWNKTRFIARAWFESFIAFEIVLHAKDLIQKDVLIQASIAAFFPIILRWIDPKDDFPNGA
jgi:hypothetical protein